MDLLEKVQCNASRLALGYMRTTPKNAVLAKAKIPPITFQLKFLGSSFVTRAVSNSDHQVKLSLQQMARV
jgi:hypothetical protein